MDFAIDLLFRWLHIFGGIMLVGGTIYLRCVGVPAVMEAGGSDELREAARRRWARIVMLAILLLLVSGLVNFVRIVQRYELASWYHMLFGIKFLLALAVFFLASVLSGRSAAAQRFRHSEMLWLNLNLVLMVAIVCISGALRFAPKTPKPPQPLDESAAVLPAEERGSGFPACRRMSRNS